MILIILGGLILWVVLDEINNMLKAHMELEAARPKVNLEITIEDKRRRKR
jgi:hypothetical protein